MELVTLELEKELPFFETCAPVLEWYPLAAIPDDDSACTVIPGGDDSFELSILERMILDLYGEALVVRVL